MYIAGNDSIMQKSTFLLGESHISEIKGQRIYYQM